MHDGMSSLPRHLSGRPSRTPRTRPAVKAAPGFRSHAAHASDDGFVVTEIWENAADHKVSFATSVRPNLPSQRSWSQQEVRDFFKF